MKIKVRKDAKVEEVNDDDNARQSYYGTESSPLRPTINTKTRNRKYDRYQTGPLNTHRVKTFNDEESCLTSIDIRPSNHFPSIDCSSSPV